MEETALDLVDFGSMGAFETIAICLGFVAIAVYGFWLAGDYD